MPPDLQVQTSGLQGFIPCVLELGGDLYQLLAELDLSPARLKQADGRISIATFCALLNTAANALNRADFGLILGSRQDFSALGALGMLMQHCRSVGEAFIPILIEV